MVSSPDKKDELEERREPPTIAKKCLGRTASLIFLLLGFIHDRIFEIHSRFPMTIRTRILIISAFTL